MSDDPTPTTSRHQLGHQLRLLRQERGLLAEDVAKSLHVSVSKISRIETGARNASVSDVEALGALYGLDPDARKMLHTIASQGRRRRRPAPQPDAMQTDDVTLQDSGFLDLERDAVRVREFNGGVIPGLLQTEEYMRAVMVEATPGIDEALVRRAMTGRRVRQRVLGRGIRYEVILDEPALLRRVGGARVMADQIAALCCAVREGVVKLGVLPLQEGAHPALNSMFVALTMATHVPDVVFLESVHGHVSVRKPEEVRRFDRIWEQLWGRAEPSIATEERLRELEANFRLASR